MGQPDFIHWLVFAYDSIALARGLSPVSIQQVFLIFHNFLQWQRQDASAHLPSRFQYKDPVWSWVISLH